ncbi:hypothetical protein [Aquimarina sediminis]|uniref:hypothetical protein n=1 Tax=Aquimarina sediminis TaxID=2070536 RepID=UPI000FFE7F89|nr:hypothetical protein [Aquimarina sediminis]
MQTSKIQFIISFLFIIGYMILVTIILVVEISDTLNMKAGGNSMMGELKILLGVLTGGVGQILNYWFNKPKEA